MTPKYDLVVLHIETQSAFVVTQSKVKYAIGDVIIKEPLTNVSQEFDYGDHRFKVIGFQTLHNGSVEIYCNDVNRPESHLKCLRCGGDIEVDICVDCLREEPYNGYVSGKVIYDGDYIFVAMIYLNPDNEIRMHKGFVCPPDMEEAVKTRIQEELEEEEYYGHILRENVKSWWWAKSIFAEGYTGVSKWALLSDWIIETLADRMPDEKA